MRLPVILTASALLALCNVVPLSAQGTSASSSRLLGTLVEVPAEDDAVAPHFRSVADSLEWVEARRAAYSAPRQRLVISLFERRLLWMDGQDTVFVARIAVGTGDTLSFGRKSWEFATPRGRRVVRAKEEAPVWVPPLWHYVEYARETGRKLVELQHGRPVHLPDGSQMLVRGNQVGRLLPDGTFDPVESGDHVIYEDTLFVPPFGTVNRRISGELGEYKLDLGAAILIHGTPHKSSIGTAATHGCVRVGDEDLAFLYRHVPVGTPVYIY